MTKLPEQRTGAGGHVRERDADTEALIPDLTHVDIHEEIPELRAPPAERGHRAATLVRWLRWPLIAVALVTVGVVLAMVLTRGDEGMTAAEFAALEDAVVPASVSPFGVTAAEFAALEGAVRPASVSPVGVTAAEFAALEDAVAPAPASEHASITETPAPPAASDLPAIVVPRGESVAEFAALEDAVVPANAPLVGVSAAEFAALEDAVVPATAPLVGVSAAEFAALEDVVTARS